MWVRVSVSNPEVASNARLPSYAEGLPAAETDSHRPEIFMPAAV